MNNFVKYTLIFAQFQLCCVLAFSSTSKTNKPLCDGVQASNELVVETECESKSKCEKISVKVKSVYFYQPETPEWISSQKGYAGTPKQMVIKLDSSAQKSVSVFTSKNIGKNVILKKNDKTIAIPFLQSKIDTPELVLSLGKLDYMEICCLWGQYCKGEVNKD